MKIDELGLSDQARNGLKRNGVHTVEQLLEMTPEDLRGLRGIGETLADEITDKLHTWWKREKKKTPGR